MKEIDKKILGEQRRKLLLQWLMESVDPLTGGELAKRTKVSRQVIVQDMSLLKAKGEPIMATAQGYIYVEKNAVVEKPQQVIACNHHPNETEAELNMIVDFGVTVKDVTIEHPVYGDLTASLMIKNRHDVKMFIEKISTTKAALLSELTDGTHLHTLEADSFEQIAKACSALKESGYLLEV
jgi:uncharacterized protein